MNTSITSYYGNYVPKFFYIHTFMVKYENSAVMLPYETVQMKEPFSFHITFCAKTFFGQIFFCMNISKKC